MQEFNWFHLVTTHPLLVFLAGSAVLFLLVLIATSIYERFNRRRGAEKGTDQTRPSDRSRFTDPS